MNVKNSLLLLLASSIFITISCSKNNITTQNSIVGNWKITGYFTKDLAGKETDQFSKLIAFSSCFKDVIFIFKEDGTLTSSKPTNCNTDNTFNFVFKDFPGIKEEGRYAIKNNKLTIVNADGNTSTIDISLTKNEMTWDNISYTRFVFTKQ